MYLAGQACHLAMHSFPRVVKLAKRLKAATMMAVKKKVFVRLMLSLMG